MPTAFLVRVKDPTLFLQFALAQYTDHPHGHTGVEAGAATKK